MSIRKPVSVVCACGCGGMTKGQSKSGFIVGHANRGRRGSRALEPGLPESVLIDDEDRQKFGCYRWSLSGNGYVQRHVVIAPGKYTKLRLHREIMQAKPGQIVDHINGNRQDCRRQNLRLVDEQGNAQNLSLSSRNTSGFRGVSWRSATGQWYAHAKINGKMISLGFFDDLQEAARVAREYRQRHYKAFVDR